MRQTRGRCSSPRWRGRSLANPVDEGAEFGDLAVLLEILDVVELRLSYVRVQDNPRTAQWLWLAAMAFPLSTLLVERWTERDTTRTWTRRARDGAPAVVLLLFALAIRVPDLTGSPLQVHGDEAACGIWGRLLAQGHTPLLVIGWAGVPMLSYVDVALGLRVVQDSLLGARAAHAVEGALSIALLYWLGREWFGRRAGFIGATLLAVSQFHLLLSRDRLTFCLVLYATG